MDRRFQPEDRQTTLDLAHCAQQAAELAGCAIHAMSEVSQIQDAIDSRDWSWMWNTLQKVLDQYGSLIFWLSPLTDIHLVRLTSEEISKMTVDDLVFQLRIATGFIFAHHALDGLYRTAFKKHFARLSQSIIHPQRH